MSTSERMVSEPESAARAANADHPTHLAEGVSPIMACIGTEKDFKDELSSQAHPFDMQNPSLDTDNVDYYEDPRMPRRKGMKNATHNAYGDTYNSYVISGLNARNKFSEKFRNCTSLIATGVDKETGENISILSHQDPECFLEESREEFEKDLAESLHELKDRSIPRTVDVAITGGNYFASENPEPDDEEYRQKYTDSVQLLTEQVMKCFGFSPIVIAGPKTTPGGDMMFYQTSKRRLYLMRPEAMRGKKSNSSYSPEDLHNEAQNWKE